MSDTILQSDYVIPISTTLATELGLKEAIILQQIHYWLNKYKDDPEHNFDDQVWVYNTFDDWKKQLPFYGVATIKRAIYNLVEKKILKTGWFNKKAYDHTNWYTIDYEVLQSLVNTDCIKMIQSNVSKRYDGLYQNDTDYTIEYSQENTGRENNENNSIGCCPQEQHTGAEIKAFIWNSEEEYQGYINDILKEDVMSIMSEMGKSQTAGLKTYQIIKYFFQAFNWNRKIKHPRIRVVKLKEIIEQYYSINILLDNDDDLDVNYMYELIEIFFRVKRKNNYQIYIFSETNTLMCTIGMSSCGDGSDFVDINEMRDCQYY